MDLYRPLIRRMGIMARRALIVTTAAISCVAGAEQTPGNAGYPSMAKWTELSTVQRMILAPLESEWDNLDPQCRHEWLRIVSQWPRLSREDRKHAWDLMRD